MPQLSLMSFSQYVSMAGRGDVLLLQAHAMLVGEAPYVRVRVGLEMAFSYFLGIFGGFLHASALSVIYHR